LKGAIKESEGMLKKQFEKGIEKIINDIMTISDNLLSYKIFKILCNTNKISSIITSAIK